MWLLDNGRLSCPQRPRARRRPRRPFEPASSRVFSRVLVSPLRAMPRHTFVFSVLYGSSGVRNTSCCHLVALALVDVDTPSLLGRPLSEVSLVTCQHTHCLLQVRQYLFCCCAASQVASLVLLWSCCRSATTPPLAPLQPRSPCQLSLGPALASLGFPYPVNISPAWSLCLTYAQAYTVSRARPVTLRFYHSVLRTSHARLCPLRALLFSLRFLLHSAPAPCLCLVCVPAMPTPVGCFSYAPRTSSFFLATSRLLFAHVRRLPAACVSPCARACPIHTRHPRDIPRPARARNAPFPCSPSPCPCSRSHRARGLPVHAPYSLYD